MTAESGLVSSGQAATPYADALERHRERLQLQFAIPGHAYGAGRLQEFLGSRAQELDIPQLIPGIDLGADNAYARSLRLAAEAWSARKTWFLTNGASQGNRMAVMAARTLGPRMLVQRNSHSSVYDGLVMAGTEPVYAMPVLDETHHIAQVVTPESIADQLAAAQSAGSPITSVLVVSPNYFGAVADIPGIARVCEQADAALIVDGSWGAHFGFHVELPESPLRQGATILLTSIHKLGGSLTQSAMLHLADTRWADAFEHALDSAYRLTESTSLNSLLLASLDIARSELATGGARIGESLRVAERMRRAVDRHPRLTLAEQDFRNTRGIVAVDPLHVVIDVRGLGVTGTELKHELVVGDTATMVEIATPTTIVATIGAGFAPDGDACIRAIEQAADALRGRAAEQSQATAAPTLPPPPGRMVLTPREAYFSPQRTVPIADAVGAVASDLLSAYPPGIPNVVPGERVTQEMVDYLRHIVRLPGGYVRGSARADLTVMNVCDTGSDL